MIRTSSSAKERLRMLLWSTADQRGFVSQGPRDLAATLGLGDHETVHLIWSLQKEGAVTFREGTAGELSRLRIRRGAHIVETTTKIEVEDVNDAVLHLAGKDTDLSAGPRFEGELPPTASIHWDRPTKRWAGVIRHHRRSGEMRAFKRQSRQETISAMWDWWRSPGLPTKRMLTYRAKRGEPATVLQEPQDQPEPAPESVIEAMAQEFPIARSLAEREQAVMEAARLLESVGLEDAALKALEDAKLSPVEAEYLRFMRFIAEGRA